MTLYHAFYVQVKPGKIVSGQEADKTNLLLQALATVIENKVLQYLIFMVNSKDMGLNDYYVYLRKLILKSI